MAVELLVALLHHPLKGAAPPDAGLPVSEPTEHPLGLLPHQLRGYITHYQPLLVSAVAFDKCTGCSDAVVAAFRARGMEFVFSVLADTGCLERLTGLDKLQAEAEAAIAAWEADAVDGEDGDGDDF